MLPNYVLAALLSSTVVPPGTWGSLGLVGGNVLTPSSSMQTPQFFNAFFDSRAVTDQSANPVAKDANGWPAAAWQAVLSASNSGVNTTDQPHLKTGALSLTQYLNCEFKTFTAAPCVITMVGGGSIVGLTKVSDDGTIQRWTYTLNVTLDTNVTMNGSQAMWDMYIPWDGSTPNNVLNPIYNSVWLAYNAQCSVLRLMNYASSLDGYGGLSGIGKVGESKWSDPVYGRVPNLTNRQAPHSWEGIFDFALAVHATGRTPKPWITLPGYTDADYATNLATLANTKGMPPMIIEPGGDEPWNTAYTFSAAYQYKGIQEAQVIANYGPGTIYSGLSGTNAASKITSVTSDANGDVTVVTNDTMATRLPLVKAGLNYTLRFSLGSGLNTWNSVGVPMSAVTTNGFTYPTRGVATYGAITGGSGGTPGTYNNVPMTGGSGGLTTAKVIVGAGGNVTSVTVANAGYHYVIGDSLSCASSAIGNTTGFSVLVATLGGPPASTTLTGIFGMQIALNDTNKIASVTSDGATPPNITVTTNVALSSFPFSVAAGVKLVAVNQQHNTWNVGSLASPAVITSVTSNSFTFPSVNAPASSTMAAADQYGIFIGQVASSGVGLDSDLVKCRPTFDVNALGTAWLVRLIKQQRDAWIAVRPQDRFALNQQAALIGTSQPRALVMAAYYGTLSGSVYNPPASWLGDFTVAPYNQLLSAPADVNAAFTAFATNLSGTIGNEMEAASFWGHYYGVRTTFYECGVDIQNASALQIEISSDVRMQTTAIPNYFAKAYQCGIKEACFFQITPSPFVENNNQGGWGAQQTITDTFTNFKMLGLLSMLTQTESYATKNGTTPCNFPLANIQGSDNMSTNNSNASYPLGIKYFGSSGVRDAMWLAASNGPESRTCVVPGTDSVAGTQATISIIQNGVTTVQGTVVLPQGGAGNSSSCTIGNSTSLTVNVPKGVYILVVGFASGQGATPGIGGPPSLS